MTTWVTFWDNLCSEHGGLSHAVLHEAAHAVLAVRAGIAFVDVSVTRDPRDHRSDLGRLTGGGVQIDPRALERFVSHDPAAALPFFLGGALSEMAAFGHCLNESYAADLNLWRNLAGLLEGQTEETLGAALGRPFEEIVTQTKQALVTDSAAVTSVARALGNRDDYRLVYREVLVLLSEPAEA